MLLKNAMFLGTYLPFLNHDSDITILSSVVDASSCIDDERIVHMSLGHLLSQGGWAMWPIYICSVVALAVFCQRFVVYLSIRHKQLPWLRPLLMDTQQGKLAQVQEDLEDIPHPIARVLLAATKVSRHRRDRVEAEAKRVGTLELQRYESFLPLLGFITQVAPLLGLLGTVLGMVKMFFGLQTAGMSNVDVSALSTGIWQALLTTAAGLIVAAPSLAAHTYLLSRVDTFRLQMSNAIEQFLTALPTEEQHDDDEVAILTPSIRGASPSTPPLGHNDV